MQASTLGSLEALLEFLKTSKIPVCMYFFKPTYSFIVYIVTVVTLVLACQYCSVSVGPVHKRDVMKASVMLEHDNQ